MFMRLCVLSVLSVSLFGCLDVIPDGPCHELADGGLIPGCLGTREVECSNFAGNNLPISTERSVYPPAYSHSIVAWVPLASGLEEYWPGSCCDLPNEQETPAVHGNLPSLVKHEYKPDGSAGLQTHYFVNVRPTDNRPAREPGVGQDWRLYWKFACTECALAICFE